MKKFKTVLKIVLISVGVIAISFFGFVLYCLYTYTSIIPSNNPSEFQINSYGKGKFVKQALEYKTTETINPELSNTFHPKRIELYDDGVLLVFAENRGYIKGLYVSPQAKFEEAFGSGLYFAYRSEHIGIVEIKKRIPCDNPDLKGLGYYSNHPNEL